MRPVTFKGNNGILRAPEGHPSCTDLPVLADGNAVVSCWELDMLELAEIARTKKVWLCVEGVSQPPLFLTGFKDQVLVEEEGDDYAIPTSEAGDDTEEHD